MRLDELIDVTFLNEMIMTGFVRRQYHPSEPLAILNYTEQAMFKKVWNEVTSTCRGLIYNIETLEIVARPFSKFFNYGETGAIFPMDAPVVATDKQDGSLGILYPLPSGGWAIATRGSFTSDQAIHGTMLLKREYGGWAPTGRPGITYLFEIIYPFNRIVLDYGELDALVLLGAVDIETGQSYGPDGAYSWTGPRTQILPYPTLEAALKAVPRPNAEGMVIHFTETDTRVKIKQDDYVALHRIITGTNARVVWEYMAVNACKDRIKKPQHWGSYLKIDPKDADRRLEMGSDWLEKLIETVPDEFYQWLRLQIAEIGSSVGHLRCTLGGAMVSRQGMTRREFVDSVTPHPHRGLLFQLYDGRDIETQLWLSARPGAEKPFMTVTEDTA